MNSRIILLLTCISFLLSLPCQGADPKWKLVLAGGYSDYAMGVMNDYITTSRPYSFSGGKPISGGFGAFAEIQVFTSRRTSINVGLSHQTGSTVMKISPWNYVYPYGSWDYYGEGKKVYLDMTLIAPHVTAQYHFLWHKIPLAVGAGLAYYHVAMTFEHDPKTGPSTYWRKTPTSSIIGGIATGTAEYRLVSKLSVVVLAGYRLHVAGAVRIVDDLGIEYNWTLPERNSTLQREVRPDFSGLFGMLGVKVALF